MNIPRFLGFLWLVAFALPAWLASPGRAATVSWAAAVSGNWNDPARWTGGVVPAAGDSVVITNAGTYTVTANVPATVSGLQLGAASGTATLAVSGGTLTLNGPGVVDSGGRFSLQPNGVLAGGGDLTVSGAFSWSGGAIEGTGKLVFNGGSAVEVVNGGQRTLRERTVVNRTTVNWPCVNVVYVGFGAVWQNEAGSVLDLTDDAQIYYWSGTAGLFQNAGTVRKSGGTATGYFDWNVANQAAFEVNKGTVLMRQGAVLAGGWTVATGATLGFNGGVFTTHASTGFAGGGRFVINGGTYTVAVPQTHGVWMELAPNGILNGPADLTVNGKFTWSGGNIEGAGKLVFNGGSVAEVVNGGQRSLRDRMVVNRTTVSWPCVNAVYVGFGAVWQNEVGSVLDLTDDAQIYYWAGSAGLFQNAGTVRKSGGTATGYFDWNVANQAAFEVNTGTLLLRQGAVLAGGWTVATGATMGFNGGVFTTHASTGFAGGGRFVINGGTYTVAVPQTHGVWMELAPNGILNGPADLTLNGKFTWSGGAIEGTGKLVFNGGSAVEVVNGGQRSLRDRTVVNRSTVSWPCVNAVYVGFGAVWQNEAGSVLDLTDDAQIYYWAATAGLFQNAGTVRKSGGTATGYFDWNVANQAAFEVNKGTLLMRQGAVLAGGWTVATGATLGFNGGVFTTHASTGFAGGGRFVINGGTYTVAVPQTHGVWMELAPNGILNGPADLTVNGKFTWSGGNIEGAGKLVFNSGSAVEVVNGGQRSLRDRTVVNRTTVSWPCVNAVYVGFGAVWQNEAGSVLDLTDDAQIYYWASTAGLFQNAGTVRKSGGTATGYFDWNVANQAAFEVNKGTLLMRQGAVLAGGWTVATGATLGFNGGVFTTHASTGFAGGGRFVINGGTYTVAVPQTHGVWMELAPNGILNGPADLTVNGKFTWSGGNIEGAGKLVFNSGSAVEVVNGGQRSLRDRTVVNRTTVSWPCVNAVYVGFGAVWQNEAGSVLDLTDDAQIYYWAGTPGTFQNAGALRKTGGNATGYFDFSVSNSGSVNLARGTLQFRQGYQQSAGQLLLDEANAGGNIAFRVSGGSVEGAGLVDGLLDVAGEVRPGRPLGRLRIGNAYTNAPTLRTIIQIGGTQGGTNHDQIVAAGPMWLAGELRVEFANGFVPSGSDSFVILSGLSRTGTFSATNAPAGYAADLIYTSTNVTLRLVQSAVTPPVIVTPPADLAVNDGQPASFTVEATGSGLTYQWRRNGSNIPGATSATYPIPAARFTDFGSYAVVVANSGGSVTSSEALLTVNPTSLESGLVARYPFDNDVRDVVGERDGVVAGTVAYVTAGARNQALRLNGSSWLALGEAPGEPMADGTVPLSVSLWIRPRATATMVPFHLNTTAGEFVLYLGSGQPGDLSTHFGFRGNAFRASTDPRSRIPSMLGCWTHVAVVYRGGSKGEAANYALYVNGESLPLDSSVNSNPLPGYSEIGRNINGANGYVVGDLDEVRVYERVVRAEDAVALAADAPACVPEILLHPVGGTVNNGGQITLGVTAIGREPLAYQWSRNGQPLPGETSSVFSRLATVDQSGTYRVTVTNIFGTAVSSNAVVSVVVPPPPGLAGLNTGTTEWINSASFLNAFAGWYVTGGGWVGVTGNGGQTWNLSNTGVTTPLNAVQLIGGVGYIAGANGVICVSTNNGASWIPFNTGTTATFYGLSFSTPTSGWAVGSGGTICWYNGRTWVPYVTGTSANFYGVAVAGSGAWAVGSGGTICWYNGTGWVPVNTGVAINFYGVAFLNANFGYAVGAGGTICRYNGTGWVPLNTGTTGTFRKVVIVDASTAFASGDGGLLCVTRNGGDTWEPLGAGSNADLYGLAFSGGRLFGFGSGGAGFAVTPPTQPVNLPPLITLTFPTNTAQFRACLQIPLTAVATDPDGTVAKVEFFRGPYKLAEFTRPPRGGRPFQTWFDTDALGFYEVRAVATDDDGAVTVSDPVTIEVVPWPLDHGVVERFDDNGCHLCFFGEIGRGYVLEGSNDPVGTGFWTPLSTNSIPEPFLRVTDTNAVALPMRFYRFRRME